LPREPAAANFLAVPAAAAFAFAVLLALAPLASSCRGADEVSCQQAADAYVALTAQTLAAEVEGQALEEARTGLPGVAAQLVETCKRQAWSAEVRRCISTAKTAEDLEGCHHPGHAPGNADEQDPGHAPGNADEQDPGHAPSNADEQDPGHAPGNADEQP
jgi:hypothetical protein